MSLTRWQEPNLSRAPFVNERPVRRLAVTLWVLFAVVAGIAAWQSRSSRQETSSRVAELVRLNSETVSARERAVSLESELRKADLTAQNERTEFLNRRLAERTFSWSNLLESLTQAMPRGVRLMQLSPEGFTTERLRATNKPKSAATTRVAMRITGEAEDTEALLEFIDRLFQHPAFDRPNLAREAEKKDLRIQFQLAVTYLPEVAGQLGTGRVPEVTPAVASARPGGAPAGAPSSAASAAAAASGERATIGARPASPAQSLATAGRPARNVAGGAGGAGDAKPGAGRPGLAGEKAAPQGGTRAEDPRMLGGDESSAENLPVTPGRSGSGFRAGSTPPGGAAPSTSSPGAGAGRFPANVMPTPLRPYASSTGGGQ